MRLISELVSVNEHGACCIAEVKESLPFVDSDGHLPGWVGIELMAQTVGVWGGWQSVKDLGKSKVGMLLGARKYESDCDLFPKGARLVINAQLVMRDGNMGAFQCSIDLDGQTVARSQLNAFMPNDDELMQILERT